MSERTIREKWLRMPIVKTSSGYWITKVLSEISPVGPYDTKVEALDVREGLRRFARENPEYVSTPTELKQRKKRLRLAALLDE